MDTKKNWAQLRAGAAEKKIAQVHQIADTLGSNATAALLADESGYGEGGWLDATGGLSDKDRFRLALECWYAEHGIPAPRLHILAQEADRIMITVPAARQLGDLVSLESTLRWAWSAETSASPDRFTENRPETGQCAVTALLVQQVFGGELLRVIVTHSAGGTEAVDESHYFNLLPDGREVDLTRGQFAEFNPGGNVTEPEFRTRDYLLSNENTAARYRLLAERSNLPYVEHVDA